MSKTKRPARKRETMKKQPKSVQEQAEQYAERTWLPYDGSESERCARAAVANAWASGYRAAMRELQKERTND